MKTKHVSLLIALTFSLNTSAQKVSEDSFIFLKTGVGIGSFESNFRASINEYFRPIINPFIKNIDDLESPVMTHASMEIVPPGKNYYLNFKYQPHFKRYSFYNTILTTVDGQAYTSTPTEINIGFHNHVFSMSIGQVFKKSEPIHFRLYGGMSINSLRSQFRISNVQSRSTLSLAPGFLVGGEMGFGHWDGPLSLRLYMQHNISGSMEIESQSFQLHYPELNELVESRLEPTKVFFTWFELGVQLAFKLR